MVSKLVEPAPLIYSELFYNSYIRHILNQKRRSRDNYYGKDRLLSNIVKEKGIVTSEKELLQFLDVKASTLSNVSSYVKMCAKQNPNKTWAKELNDTNEKKCKDLYEQLQKANGLTLPDKDKKEEFLYINAPQTGKAPPQYQARTSTIFPNFPITQIIEAAKNPDNQIFQIMDTWVSDIFVKKSYPIDFSISNLLNENPNLKCQMLVLNPTEEAFNLRLKSITSNKELELKHHNILTEKVQNLEIFKDWQDVKYRNRFEVRLFNDLVGVNAYITSSELFYGHYFSFDFAKNNSFYQVPNQSDILINDEIRRNFNTLWERNVSNRLDQNMVNEFIEEKDAISNLYKHTDKDNYKIQAYLPKKVFEDTPLFRKTDDNADGQYLEFKIIISKEDNNFLKTDCQFPDGTRINGVIRTMHEKYYRCQFNYRTEKIVINLVIPLELDYGDVNTALFSLIFNKRAFCGLSVIVRNDSPTNNYQENLLKIDKKVSELNKSFWFPAIIPPQPNGSVNAVSGQYLVYAYGRSEDKKIRIETNIIRIAESGFVQYIKKDGEVHAEGVASIDKYYNLHLDLTEKVSQLHCHFIFHTQEKKVTSDNLFCGLYLGISQTRDKTPKAVRAVMKWLPPQTDISTAISRVEIHSPEYKKLDEGIKKALTGRIGNFINWRNAGFTAKELLSEVKNNSKKIYNITDVFVLAACYDIIINGGRKKLDLENLERAIRHGYTDFEDLKGKISEIDRRIKKVISGNLAYPPDANYYHELLINSEEYKNLLSKYGFASEAEERSL